MDTPGLDNVGELGGRRGDHERSSGMLHAGHNRSVKALEQHHLARRELAQRPGTVGERVGRPVGRNGTEAAADLAGADDDRFRRKRDGCARSGMRVAHAHRQRARSPLDGVPPPDDLGLVVVVVLAAVPNLALTAGCLVAAGLRARCPTSRLRPGPWPGRRGPQARRPRRRWQRWELPSVLTADLRPVIEPHLSFREATMPCTPRAPGVTRTEEFAPGALSRHKHIFRCKFDVPRSLRHSWQSIGDPGNGRKPGSHGVVAPRRNEARNSSTSALERVRRIGGRAWTRCQR